MPNINDLSESKYLKQGDVERPILVTIRSCTQHNLAQEGQSQDMKWCLNWVENHKPMVLNATNGQIIASIIGSDNTDDWIEHTIVLFRDPNVSYQGKLVGGIRARAPRNKTITSVTAPAPAQPAPAPAPVAPLEDDDVPF